MLSGISLTALISLTVLPSIFCVVVALLSRHKKACEVDLIGSFAFVEKPLEPEGAVLVRGELWRARFVAASGTHAKAAIHGARVCVIGVRGHLLLVELAAY